MYIVTYLPLIRIISHLCLPGLCYVGVIPAVADAQHQWRPRRAPVRQAEPRGAAGLHGAAAVRLCRRLR